MADELIPLFDLRVSPEAKRLVREVLASGWLNTGPKAKELERAIARLSRVRYAAAVNSATSGLQLCLETLGIGRGDEVITTPFTFAATAAVILRTGARPIFADIDPSTLTVDPDEVARKISRKTRAVIAVDIAGLPADYPRLKRLLGEKSIPLLADAAHSLGGGIGRKSVGQMADAAVHSFQATKNLTTGDGGMVLSRHKEFVERVRLLSNHAMTTTAHQRRRSGRWEYDIVALGQKANLTDLQAAVGLGQLSVFEKSQAARARLAERYQKRLAEAAELVELPVVPGRYRHAWHLFIVKLHLSRLKIDRNRLIRLMADDGIECGVHYRPLFEMPYYRKLGLKEQHFPNAAYAGRRVVTLPLYPSLNRRQVDFVCERLRRHLTRHAR